MKNLISIIAVILVVIFAMGAISSLTEGVGSGGDGGSSTTTTTTRAGSNDIDPEGGFVVDDNLTVYNYCYSFGSSVQTELANYTQGICFDYELGEENDRIYMGLFPKKDNSEGIIAFAFDGLEVGKTYLLHFYHSTDIIDSTFYYHLGNVDQNVNLNSFDVGNSTDYHHSFVFEATATSFQLGVLHFPEMPSQETLDVYAAELKSGVMFTLYEVME